MARGCGPHAGQSAALCVASALDDIVAPRGKPLGSSRWPFHEMPRVSYALGSGGGIGGGGGAGGRRSEQRPFRLFLANRCDDGWTPSASAPRSPVACRIVVPVMNAMHRSGDA